jgi:hypothetical protein
LWARASSSSFLARRTCSPWVSSQRSWSKPRRSTLLLTENFSPAMQESGIHVISWMAVGSPWCRSPTQGQHASAGRCLTWPSSWLFGT